MLKTYRLTGVSKLGAYPHSEANYKFLSNMTLHSIARLLIINGDDYNPKLVNWFRHNKKMVVDARYENISKAIHRDYPEELL